MQSLQHGPDVPSLGWVWVETVGEDGPESLRTPRRRDGPLAVEDLELALAEGEVKEAEVVEHAPHRPVVHLFVESGLGEEVTELGGPVLERRVALDLLLQEVDLAGTLGLIGVGDAGAEVAQLVPPVCGGEEVVHLDVAVGDGGILAVEVRYGQGEIPDHPEHLCFREPAVLIVALAHGSEDGGRAVFHHQVEGRAAPCLRLRLRPNEPYDVGVLQAGQEGRLLLRLRHLFGLSGDGPLDGVLVPRSRVCTQQHHREATLPELAEGHQAKGSHCDVAARQEGGGGGQPPGEGREPEGGQASPVHGDGGPSSLLGTTKVLKP